jgi:hypothetical protein
MSNIKTKGHLDVNQDGLFYVVNLINVNLFLSSIFNTFPVGISIFLYF